MQTKTLLAAVALLFLSTGCSSVSSTKQLGQPVTDVEAKQLEGIWLIPDEQPIHIRHVAGNELRMAGIEWKDGSFELVEMTLHVTRDNDVLYVNLTHGKSNEPTTYSFLRLSTIESELLLAQGPNVTTFEQAVADGKINGTIERKQHETNVALDPDGKQLDEFVSPSRAAEQFNFEEPLVLRRIKRFKDDSTSQDQ